MAESIWESDEGLIENEEKFKYVHHLYRIKHHQELPKCIEWIPSTKSISIKRDSGSRGSSIEDTVQNVKGIIQQLKDFHRDTDLIVTKEELSEVDEVIDILYTYGFTSVLVLKRALEGHAKGQGHTQLVIMSSNYDDIMNCKHKFKVKLKRISAPSINRANRKLRQSSIRHPANKIIDTIQSDEKGTRFMTYEGMEVWVYPDSIIEMRDPSMCIVNPINDRYEPTGNVSLALMKKGGKKFNNELDKLKTRSQIRPACECDVTGGGDLGVAKVVHLVCPRNRISLEKTCKRNVFKSVVNCLEEADQAKMGSIAFPFIYTGKRVQSVEKCCHQYAYAALEFSRTKFKKESSSLKKIYFVSNKDKDIKVANAVFRLVLPQQYEQLFRIIEEVQVNPYERDHCKMKYSADNGEADTSTANAEYVNVMGTDGTVTNDAESVVNSEPVIDGNVDDSRMSRGYEVVSEMGVATSSHDSNEGETDSSAGHANIDVGGAIAMHDLNGKSSKKGDEERIGYVDIKDDNSIEDTGDYNRSMFLKALENFGGHIEVCFVTKDIRSVSTIALVSPVGSKESIDDEVNGNDLIGASIKAAYHYTFADSEHEEKIKMHRNNKKYVALTRCKEGGEQRQAKYIFHIMVPTFTHTDNTFEDFQDGMNHAFEALLKKIEKMNKKKDVIREVAMSLFGLSLRPSSFVASQKTTRTRTQKQSTVAESSQDQSTLDTTIDSSSDMHKKIESISRDLSDIKAGMNNVMKKDDIKNLITSTIKDIISSLEEKVRDSVERKIKEHNEKLQDQIDALTFENEQLKDRISKVEELAEENKNNLQKESTENNKRINDAVKMANYNEQYSRKNNIKIKGVKQKEGETEESLTKDVCDILATHGAHLRQEDILAIHRIPSRRAGPRPVLVKTKNNNAKTKVMRQRKALNTAGNRVADDVTTLNTGLIGRLLLHAEIKSAWFFNGSVYALTNNDDRIKFDIFDEISHVIESFRSK